MGLCISKYNSKNKNNEHITTINFFKNRWDFENLVIECDMTSSGYLVGAYFALHKYNIMFNMKRYIGVSGGSIFATLFSLHMEPIIIKNEIIKLDMSYNTENKLKFYEKYGLYSGDKIERWIENILYRYTKIKYITFSQILKIYGNELYIMITNLSKFRKECIGPYSHPNVCVSKIIRQALNTPILYDSIKNNKEDYIIDGKIGNIFPLNMFDTKYEWNRNTIGLRTQINYDSLGYNIQNIVDYSSAIIKFQEKYINKLYTVMPGYAERTIVLNINTRNTSNITTEQKLKDIKMGEIECNKSIKLLFLK